MRTIIIEDTVYKVSEREYRKIDTLQSVWRAASTLDYKLYQNLEFELDTYLTEAKKNYKYVGVVSFDFRL